MIWVAMILGIVGLTASVGVLLLVRRWLAEMRAVVIATRPLPPPVPPEHWTCDQVREDKPITPAVALQFWAGVARSEWWPGLAWRFQTDTRRWLMQARAAALDGKDAGAMFCAGAAWVASQAAVMPEAEVRLTMEVQKMEDANAQEAKDRMHMIRPSYR